MKAIHTAAIGAMLTAAGLVQAQTVVRAVADNRSGVVRAFANAPNGDPRESGFNVDPGQNDYDPFDFLFTETDTRQGCAGTNANATIDHESAFTLIGFQNQCRGFRLSTVASSGVTVTACGAGNTSFGNFENNASVVLRIENAPPTGVPMRVRGWVSAAGGAGALVRILRPNGTALLNLPSGAVNQVVNLPNGDYTIQTSSSNGMSSRSTTGTSTRSVNYGVGFWKECAGDLNGDGQVTLADLAILLAAFGVDSRGDLDSDLQTGLADLTRLLSHFGSVCTN